LRAWLYGVLLSLDRLHTEFQVDEIIDKDAKHGDAANDARYDAALFAWSQKATNPPKKVSQAYQPGLQFSKSRFRKS
jgi:hypothetical protein